MFVEELTT